MRKGWGILLAVLLVFCLSAVALAADAVQLSVDGKPVEGDSSAFSENGRTMVPIRFVMDELGAIVNWDGPSRTATIYKDTTILSLQPDNRQITVNGVVSEMETPAVAIDGRIFVPIRFIAELFNATVNWNSETKCVEIWFPKGSSFKIVGYYYDDASRDCYFDYDREFDSVVHFNYALTADGHVAERTTNTPDRFEDIEISLRYFGQEKLMLITGFYAYIVDGIVADPAKRASVIADILQLMNKGRYDGVDLDIEAMSEGSKEELVIFMQELRAALGPDKTLTMSLMPRVADRQYWLDRYDYAALAEICDRIHLMFYNQHYASSSPGPNCSIEYLQQGIEYMLQYIPKEKMVIGIGGYGYDWHLTDDGPKGSSVRISTAFERAGLYNAEIKRDEASGVPYFSYLKLVNKEIDVFYGEYQEYEQTVTLTDADGKTYTEIQKIKQPVMHKKTVQVYEQHEVWFEDAQSLSEKIALARGYRVQGVALWRMGFMPQDVMDAIFAQTK